jgi:biopolymer transport protein ExbB
MNPVSPQSPMKSWIQWTQKVFFTNFSAVPAGPLRAVGQRAVPGMNQITQVSQRKPAPVRALICLVCLISLICLNPAGVLADDMRRSFAVQAEKRAQMEEKAREELARARSEAKERTRQIKQDKDALSAAIQDLKNRNNTLEKNNQELAQLIQDRQAAREALNEELALSRAENRELSGFVRSAAKDLEGLLLQSPQSALSGNGHGFLAPVIQAERFPSMTDIRAMTDAWFDEIFAAGQVRIVNGPIVDRQGLDQEARILMLGNFTGIYVLEQADAPKPEVGFLLYFDADQRFFALSRLPEAATVRRIQAYLAGERPDVPVDISRGTALRQYTLELDLAKQIPKGGPIVWPILGILGLALLILLERLVFFFRKQMTPEPFMDKLRGLVAAGDWEGCEALCQSRKNKWIPEILLTALAFRDHTRQDMENALQEAILGEIPAIERFVSTLGMLAAIAPLLGLLGTVTGMINTFHVITYYGAGDPKMMSGGISEALVTTMLGLTVAIPIMLFHTLLSRRVETQIGQMEEKAVAFVNMVFKARNECCRP